MMRPPRSGYEVSNRGPCRFDSLVTSSASEYCRNIVLNNAEVTDRLVRLGTTLRTALACRTQFQHLCFYLRSYVRHQRMDVCG